MEGSFSGSVFQRLPSAIQGLDLAHQNVFIHLRLGKRAEDIGRLVGINEEEARLKINRVREVLAHAGLIDLIEDPRFVSIHSSDEDDCPGFQLRSRDLPVEKRLILKEFLSVLTGVIEGLPRHQSQLLRLRYKEEMTARDILGFSKKIDVSFIPDKPASEICEQDVFYALNLALNEVLKRLKRHYGEESFMCRENLKFILEEVEI